MLGYGGAERLKAPPDNRPIFHLRSTGDVQVNKAKADRGKYEEHDRNLQPPILPVNIYLG